MSTIKQRLSVAISAGAVSVAAAAGIANAATKHSTASGTTGTTGAAGAPGDRGPHGNANETPLTGATLKSASDAALAANAGATVAFASAEDPSDPSGAAYEVHITKADKTRAVVLEDSAFKVLSTKADQGRGPGGHGHGGPANEAALTGSDLTKATAAAKSAVPGGTVERASAEDAAEATGAKYEVHVTKPDGSRVEVLLDSSFGLVKTVADTHGPRGG